MEPCILKDEIERHARSITEFYKILTGNGTGKPGLGELMRDNKREIKYIKDKLDKFIKAQDNKKFVMKDWISWIAGLIMFAMIVYNFFQGVK